MYTKDMALNSKLITQYGLFVSIAVQADIDTFPRLCALDRESRRRCTNDNIFRLRCVHWLAPWMIEHTEDMIKVGQISSSTPWRDLYNSTIERITIIPYIGIQSRDLYKHIITNYNIHTEEAKKYQDRGLFDQIQKTTVNNPQFLYTELFRLYDEFSHKLFNEHRPFSPRNMLELKQICLEIIGVDIINNSDTEIQGVKLSLIQKYLRLSAHILRYIFLDASEILDYTAYHYPEIIKYFFETRSIDTQRRLWYSTDIKMPIFTFHLDKLISVIGKLFPGQDPIVLVADMISFVRLKGNSISLPNEPLVGISTVLKEEFKHISSYLNVVKVFKTYTSNIQLLNILLENSPSHEIVLRYPYKNPGVEALVLANKHVFEENPSISIVHIGSKEIIFGRRH